jgi:hypothetical protein
LRVTSRGVVEEGSPCGSASGVYAGMSWAGITSWRSW